MIRAVIIVLILIGFIGLVTRIHLQNMIDPYISGPVQTAGVLEGVTLAFMDFHETGTLVFYPNNTGSVPYLFYQNRNGDTVSKALVFTAASSADFYSWSGAHVSVTGHQDQEHVIVSTIVYVSGP